jgi:hypothetical protein
MRILATWEFISNNNSGAEAPLFVGLAGFELVLR